VVWESEGNIYLYDGTETIRLSMTDTWSDEFPHVDGLVVGWIGFTSDGRKAFIATSPEPAIEAIVDLDPGVFEVKVKKPNEPKEPNKPGKPKKPKKPKEEFLEAFIELPADVNAADVDVNTVTLSVNGTTLATAELPVIVDNVLDVLFSLDPNNVGTILGLEVTKVKVGHDKVKVEATAGFGGDVEIFSSFPTFPPFPPPLPPLPLQRIDLIELTVSGELIGGGSFSGTDAVRVMLKEH